ncbi:MAG TPA: hypothetical protein VJA21_03630 [Verrucomicrobiae bacterium]
MKLLRLGGTGLVWFALLFLGGFSAFAQTNIQLLTTLSGNFGPLATSGHYLFAAGYGYPPASALRIFEVSDPAHPVDVGYQDGGGTLSGVCISGHYAYVSCNQFGGGYDLSTRILDISNPTNPVMVGKIEGPWQNGAVDGRFAYMVGGVLGVFDVSDPQNPRSVGQASLPWGYSGAIVARDGYVYLIHNYGLSIYDVSDPSNPKHCGGPVVAGALGAYGFDLSGNSACVTDGTNGLWIANVSCPTNPVIVYHQFWSGLSLAYLQGVVTSGNYAYVGGWIYSSAQGVLGLDITDPTNATLVASASGGNSSGYYLAMAPEGYLYSGDPWGLSVFSLGATAPPPLTVTCTATNNLLLSWPTPTPAFAVQQSPDLNPTNWHTSATTPVVAGGRNQVMLTKPEKPMFYRLISQ